MLLWIGFVWYLLNFDDGFVLFVGKLKKNKNIVCKLNIEVVFYWNILFSNGNIFVY